MRRPIRSAWEPTGFSPLPSAHICDPQQLVRSYVRGRKTSRQNRTIPAEKQNRVEHEKEEDKYGGYGWRR
jgi:hypothetical protein